MYMYVITFEHNYRYYWNSKRPIDVYVKFLAVQYCFNMNILHVHSNQLEAPVYPPPPTHIHKLQK